MALLCALALIAGGVLVIHGLEVPFMNTVSAILLIASGLILIGTIVCARMKRASGTGRASQPRPADRTAR